MPTSEKRAIFKDDEGNDHQYIHFTHNACDGLPMLRKIQSALTHLAGAGIAAFPSQGSILDATIDSDAFSKAFDPMFEMLCEDRNFITKLFSTVRRDGKEMNWQQIGIAYQGNYGEYFDATYWLIEENFLNPLKKFLFRKIGTERMMSLAEYFKAFSMNQGLTGSSGDPLQNGSLH